ncbi:MAG: ABC transporter ATP-binding protein, partial [Chitinispirillaceae bacterium]|nr:ABC transporter ATP-binding protein [Chitinispirillaceae bacterium]
AKRGIIMPLIELKKITKIYKKDTQNIFALREVNIKVEKGEFLAVVGPSGSGKSTLLNIIGCLDSPSQGELIYEGQELRLLNENQLADYRKNHIAFIFQSFNLIPVLTVKENVELPLIIEGKYSRNEISKKALEMLEAVELKDMANRLPKELSGGQEQRVAIARALVKKPYVVLADEPTANLDSKTAENVISIMKKLNREQQTTFIFSTHDKRVEQHARRIITLHDGMVESDIKKED